MAKKKTKKTDPQFAGHTEDDLRKAIEDSGGIVTTVANKLRVNRKSIYMWIEKAPWIKDAIESAREKLKDYAESKLVENVRAGDQRAIEYLLDHQAIDRGYGRKWRLQLAGDKDAPVQVQIVLPDNERTKPDES